MGSSKLIGTAPDQSPTNADLGTLAFQDENNVNIGGGNVVANIYSDTAISEIKPSLLLDFANGKTLDPRITFSRASTATYYDGRTTAMAEQNILYNTTDLANASWLKTNINLVANAGIAPDNTQTAAYAAMTTTSGYHYYYAGGSQVSMSIPNGTATYSIYVKPNGYTKYGFREGASTGRVITFDTSTTSVLYTTDSASTSGSVVSVGNGWYRISATFTGLTSQRYEFWMLSSSYTTGDLLVNWAGDGTSGVYLWGPQCEMRSGASAYTPVTGTNVVTNYIPALQTATSGAPRFDHDPITGESKGLLIEEQRTNISIYSQDFANNSGWSKETSTIRALATVAPDGTLTASELVDNVTNARHIIYQAFNGDFATSRAFSVYAKQNTLRYIVLSVTNAGDTNCYASIFDLQAGVISATKTNGSATLAASMQSVGNGWYRCSISGLLGTGTNNFYPIIGGSDRGQFTGALQSNDVPIYIGSGNSLYIWGAQLEAGAFPTSYMPTTSAQVTRSGDFATMTGNNFYSWYRQEEGTLYSETKALSDTVGDVQNGLSISFNGASGTAMCMLMDTRPGQNAALYVFNNGVNTGSVANSTTMLGAYRKMAGAYAVNNVAMATDGVLSNIATNTAIPPGTQLGIGVYPLSVGIFDNGYVKKIAYYPKRLSNAELQEMTS